MAVVLIVDDSAVDRTARGRPPEEGRRPGSGLRRERAGSARSDRAVKPDIVVSDLQMPEMDGLELVEAIRREHPCLPVILMTAHGSEETAVQALRNGAANYVAKRNLARELALRDERARGRARRSWRAADPGCLTRTESHFVLDNDVSKVSALVGHSRQPHPDAALRRDRADPGRGGAARGAGERDFHGNLELSSALLEEDESSFARLAALGRRRALPGRRVHVIARETRIEATYMVRDEGQGFDPSTLPDPTDLANLESRAAAACS